MGDLSERVERARDAVQLRWTPERAAAVERAMVVRGRRRVRVRASVAVLAVLLVSATIAHVRFAHEPAIARAAESNWERLPDGSRFARVTRDAAIEVRENVPGRLTLRLARGAMRFDVVHRDDRVVRVESGSIGVVVIGTVFTVARVDDRVRVSVESGRVRVVDSSHETDLARGETLEVPAGDDAHPAPATATTAEGPVRVPAPERSPESTRTERSEPVARAHMQPTRAATASAVPDAAAIEWRVLARSGAYDDAYAALGGANSHDVRDDPSDLLLAADSARLSHHAADAVPYLRAVIDRHANDPRAPLAAFALGRVLLDDLGNPREAAEAFSRAGALDPNGSLAEDALAREVEALSRAGETTGARTAALRYVERFPTGRRLVTVRRFGGLEP